MGLSLKVPTEQRNPLIYRKKYRFRKTESKTHTKHYFAPFSTVGIQNKDRGSVLDKHFEGNSQNS